MNATNFGVRQPSGAFLSNAKDLSQSYRQLMSVSFHKKAFTLETFILQINDLEPVLKIRNLAS
jgi:hypothetical protein